MDCSLHSSLLHQPAVNRFELGVLSRTTITALTHAQNPLVLQGQRRLLPSLFFLFFSPPRVAGHGSHAALRMHPVCVCYSSPRSRRCSSCSTRTTLATSLSETSRRSAMTSEKICTKQTRTHTRNQMLLTDDAALPCIHPQPPHAHSPLCPCICSALVCL